MRPELMKALLKLAQDVINGNQIEFDSALLDPRDQFKICLTLKNYKFPKGVSTQIHGVVPVLDPPEDEMIEMHDMKELETDRVNEMLGCSDEDSLGKTIRRHGGREDTVINYSMRMQLP